MKNFKTFISEGPQRKKAWQQKQVKSDPAELKARRERNAAFRKEQDNDKQWDALLKSYKDGSKERIALAALYKKDYTAAAAKAKLKL